MRIRHIVSIDNLDEEGYIIDPLLARHGLIIASKIADLAGPIDALTHLNLDFPDHHLDDCLVAERLEVGAALVWQDEHFLGACPRPEAYTHLGAVNLDTGRIAWQQALKR